MVRYLITFSGQVQGVGVRTFSHLNANRFHLTGWGKNLENGMVEVQVQGEKADIMQYLKIMQAGNMFIKVTDYSMKSIPILQDEKEYFTRYQSKISINFRLFISKTSIVIVYKKLF